MPFEQEEISSDQIAVGWVSSLTVEGTAVRGLGVAIELDAVGTSTRRLAEWRLNKIKTKKEDDNKN